jgi:hypothetical protein
VSKIYYSEVLYAGETFYVEGDVEAHQLSPRAVLVADGIQLPEGDGGCELLDLPRGALADECDPADEAACRADYLYDQERDDRLTGDRS